MKPARARVLLPSGRRLDVLDPDTCARTSRDLATGLSRTYRWAGYSRWVLRLSVARYNLAVLAMPRSTGMPSGAKARRELLDDTSEAPLGGWDPNTSLKPLLGDAFSRLVASMKRATNRRYQLPAWNDASYYDHKAADPLAVASKAFHVAGWSRKAMRDDLEIQPNPLKQDPLAPTSAFAPWEPWPPAYSADQFLSALRQLLGSKSGAVDADASLEEAA